MIKLSRNREIIKKYDKGKGKTVAELTKEYKVTKQRISQILSSKEKYCKKHDNFFYTKCQLCTAGKHIDKFFGSNEFVELRKEIDECSKRSKTVSIDCKKLIKKLRNKYRLSSTVIGDLIGRHHSTILYHCKNEKKYTRN